MVYTYTIPKMQDDEVTTFEWHHPTTSHKHCDWEFTALTEGSGDNLINDVVYPYQVGSFLLLGPKHLHQQRSSERITRRDICISVNLLKKYCDELQEGLFEEIDSLTTPIIIQPPLQVSKDIFKRLTDIDSYKTLETNYESALLHSIIIYLLGIYIENNKMHKDLSSPQWFLDFITKIQRPEYFSQKITDLIAMTNYTHAHFLVLFKQRTGQTLISYLTDIRMNYACKLLLNTEIPIIQIANETGYFNHSFFTKKFKEYFGETPLEYRRKHFVKPRAK